MIDFSSFINLPVVFAGVFALAVFVYVSLDGFDLGVGILHLCSSNKAHRQDMMAAVAPFWDGNETWLILSGGVLFIAFPLAYSILMPAFYVPILMMLMALIFRGVAFEFHYKSKGPSKRLWGLAFALGSLFATFFQGVLLGTYLQGIEWVGRAYTGGALGWLAPFPLFTGLALVAGYALLGSTWLNLKTEGSLQTWAKSISIPMALIVAFFLLVAMAWMPFVHPAIYARWLSIPNLYYLAAVPVSALLIATWLVISVLRDQSVAPFWLSHLLFAVCYAGLLITVYPHIIPHTLSFTQAAASNASLSFMLIGVVFILPVILAYTAFTYYVFRGKIHYDNA